MHSAFDPRRHMLASHPVRPSLLSVVAAMILIPAIAFASPLDPSWLGGVYNGADGDDVVNLINDLVASKFAGLPDMPSPSQFSKRPFTTKPDTISSHPSCRFTRGPPLPSRPSHLPCLVRFCTSFSSEPAGSPQNARKHHLSLGPTYIVLLDQPMSPLRSASQSRPSTFHSRCERGNISRQPPLL